MFIINLLLFFLQSFLWKDGGAPDGQGAGGSGTEGGSGENPPAPGTPPANPDQSSRTFTQDEVNRMVAERLNRERDKFKDYDDLKKKAKSYDELQDSQKSQLEREQEARAKAEREAAERIAAADSRLITAEIKAYVAGRVHNPDLIASLVRSDPKIKVNGDDVVGVKEVVDALLEANPYLKKTGSRTSGGEFNGTETKSLDEQIALAEQAGDWKRSNMLKLQKMRAGT